MDEQLQPRNPNDLLIFHNPDSEDLEWYYDQIKSPLPYLIRSGETRELPYYIAKLGVDKLIDRIMQKKNLQLNNPMLRKEEMKTIVLGVKHINYIREKTPTEMALEDMQRKKNIDPLEELLKEREVAAERVREQQRQAQLPQQPLYTTQGLPVAPQDQQYANEPPPAPKQYANEPVAPPAPAPVNPVVPPTIPPVQPTVPTPQPTVPQQPPSVPVNPQPQPVVNAVPPPPAVMPNPETIDPARAHVYSLLRNRLHMDLTHEKTKANLDALPVSQLVEEFKDQLPELVDTSKQLMPDTRESLSQAGMPESTSANPIPVAGSPVTQAPVAPVAPAPAPSIPTGPSTTPVLDSQLNSAA